MHNFANLWPKKWNPLFPSSTSQSKLDPLRNLASASSGYTFTNRICFSLASCFPGNKDTLPWSEHFVTFEVWLSDKACSLGEMKKTASEHKHFKATQVVPYKRELHWGGLALDGASAASPPLSFADRRRPRALEEAILVAEKRWEWCSPTGKITIKLHPGKRRMEEK